MQDSTAGSVPASHVLAAAFISGILCFRSGFPLQVSDAHAVGALGKEQLSLPKGCEEVSMKRWHQGQDIWRLAHCQ